ncbi:winged helix-turn-helix transcriptional regulator [Mycobacterium sp. 1081908.1]|uniref:winged helix-turn-helix transcriptional regulator n=1 Tax=Mycobacterium sp. 1081908.1 TaxID=1834066 RepID=UPI0007FE7F48|nr:winged helix-turn-helix transcriptional regulator [Mycobacterium sp. 1081908.1]OBK45384.1 transcriptional regulator [Mycobacterium sp. 1081908.1]
MASRRNYNQNCPIARGLDVVGERWTLLILRELVGGARRYGDLRDQLPGIATNLLAERLKELQEAGLVERADLPAPIGRTVYSLSDLGWQRALPILQSIAWFGLDRIDPIGDGPATPLNGFLAGILLGFDPAAGAGLEATCRAEIDGRRFDFAITQGRLAAARGEPSVTLTASAADLVNARLGSTEAKRRAALRRVEVEGDPETVDAVRRAFALR